MSGYKTASSVKNINGINYPIVATELTVERVEEYPELYAVYNGASCIVLSKDILQQAPKKDDVCSVVHLSYERQSVFLNFEPILNRSDEEVASVIEANKLEAERNDHDKSDAVWYEAHKDEHDRNYAAMPVFFREYINIVRQKNPDVRKYDEAVDLFPICRDAVTLAENANEAEEILKNDFVLSIMDKCEGSFYSTSGQTAKVAQTLAYHYKAGLPLCIPDAA